MSTISGMSRPDRLARREHRCRRRLMQLDRAIAAPQRRLAFASDLVGCADPQQAGIGRNLFAPRFAGQSMHRHALRLARQIPQRDVERGDRKHGDAVAAEQVQIALDLLHGCRDPGGIGDFEAARLRRDHLLDRGASGPRTDVSEGIAPAGEAGVGQDLDQHHVERRDRGGALPEARRSRIVGNADMVRPDVGDLHHRPP